MAIQLWHGGRRWEGGPEVRPPKEGRYECGPGIYLTNRYGRARGYAKGGGVTQQVTLKEEVRWLEDVALPRTDIESCARTLPGMRNRKLVLDDLRRTADIFRETLHASYLVNLCVNHNAVPGKAGVALAKWLVEHGIDASLHPVNALESWVIVFNPEVIKRYQVILAADIAGDADFPRILRQ